MTSLVCSASKLAIVNSGSRTISSLYSGLSVRQSSLPVWSWLVVNMVSSLPSLGLFWMLNETECGVLFKQSIACRHALLLLIVMLIKNEELSDWCWPGLRLAFPRYWRGRQDGGCPLTDYSPCVLEPKWGGIFYFPILLPLCQTPSECLGVIPGTSCPCTRLQWTQQLCCEVQISFSWAPPL